MATVLATPGVYIEEKSAFSSSVVPVATAVPAFIGYTQKAARGTKSLRNVPTRIKSFTEFEQLFGGAPKTKFNLGTDGSLEVVAETRFLLHSSMRFYFANGGADCYIVSIGDYTAGINAKDFNDLATESGLPTLLKYVEPTLLAAPEAVLLSEADCFSLQQAMVQHCGFEMRNRFAVLDVYNGDKKRTYDDEDVINRFRGGVGANHLQWAAAYYPFVKTTVVSSSEVDFTNVANLDGLAAFLTEEVASDLASGRINPARAEAWFSG
jgi:phage tail sheath protein FI